MKKSIIESHFDIVSASYDSGKEKYSFYYDSIKRLLMQLIGKNKNVFEIGCGTGDLIVSLSPKRGYGMDLSSQMINLAKNKYVKAKNIRFSTTWPSVTYDYIFMTDVIEHLEDPKKEFKCVVSRMNSKSLFINTMANPIWEPLLILWERMGLKMKEGPHKRLKFDEIEKICNQCGLKIIEHDFCLLMPIYIPGITYIVNKCFEKILKKLAFIEYFVAVKI